MARVPGAPRKWLRPLLFAGACWAAVTAWAGVPESPRPRVIGVADGLPSSNVNGMARDRRGYLWVATSDGLARYDGIGMRVWRHVPGDPASLPGNFITAVYVDDADRVWAAVEGRGVSVMDAQRRGFRHYSRATSPQIGSDETFALAGRDGVLWFGTFDGGLHRLDRDGRIVRYMPRDDDGRSLPAETVVALTFDAAGDLWVGTTRGLARWAGDDSGKDDRDGRGDFDRLALPGDNPTPVIYSVTPDPGGGDALWIGASTGIFRRERDGRWTTPDYSAMFGVPNAVLSVAAEGGGRYWFGTQRNIWRVLPGGVPVPVAMGARGPARPVQQLLRQDDGALWFPAIGRGLGYLRADWRRLAQLSPEDGLASDLYRGVTPAAAGGWWLVGEHGAEHLDPQGVPHPLPESVQDLLAEHRPISILEDSDRRLWIGTRGAQPVLLRVEADGAAVRVWAHDAAEDATLPGQLDLLAQTPDGTLWLSFSGAGLQRRDPDSGRVLATVVPGDQGVGDLEAMRVAPDGSLWVAGSTGLSRWNADRQTFEPVPGVVDGDRVYAFAFAGRDTLWLQRLSGLEHYRRERGAWRLQVRVGAEAGIPSVEGSGLQVDAAGRVWLATLRGVYRWDPLARRLRGFGLRDGLSSQEVVDRATALGPDGVLAVALEDGGVVLIDTRAPDPAPRRPALLWDRFEVRRRGRWVSLPVRAPLLSPQDRELRVQLRLLAFDDPGANRYYTRLDGYDRDWVALGAAGERVLAGLPAGAYTLRARAADAAGNTAEEKRLRFHVPPPWWRTPWAYAAFATAALLALWLLAMGYRRRLRRRHAWQLAQQQRELAEQASLAKTRFLATLGHEVRTPMTGVLGMSELLLGTPLNPQQRGYVGAIRGAGEHLLRLVNDALDLARIESGKLELADESFDLHALAEELAALLGPLARQRGLAFEMTLGEDVPQCLRGDPARVRQILLNLLGNAVKFTERGHVALAVSKLESGGVCFEVADSGPGLNAEQKGRLFRRFEQAEGERTRARYGGSGLGLAISQELAAAMSGSIEVDSTPGEGTRFSVRLPLPEATPPFRRDDGAPLPDPYRSLSLLLVEDDPTVADVLSGLLRLQGHHVVHVPHGLSALATAATRSFDAALLDLDLPGMDGLALARQMRVQGFARPLIAVTARADAGAEPAAIEAGFDHFIRKPMTQKMLAALLQRIDPATASALDETSHLQREEPA